MIPQQSQDIYSHLVISNYIPLHTILIIKHLASFYFVDDYFYHGFCYYDASEILVRIFLVLRTPGIVYDIQVAMTDALSEPRRKELVNLKALQYMYDNYISGKQHYYSNSLL